LMIAATTGGVWAAFTARTTNAGASLAGAPDWVAPTVSNAVIGKAEGGIPGFIRRGGAYNVYANVSDAGNPASGVASLAANLSTITTGQSASGLASGAFTASGTSYNRRSASLSANPALPAGTSTYSLTSTDVSGNARTQTGYTVTVDNTPPTASDIQTVNASGKTAGLPEIGDAVTFTFSEPIDPNSIIAGWAGATTSVVVHLDHAIPANDRLLVYNATNAAQLPLGAVDLGGNKFATASATFGAAGTPSTMTLSANAVTVVLGTASAGPKTDKTAVTLIWSPSATATDRAGNPASTTAQSETGPADTDF
jgi:hypothetical protein